MNIQIDQDKIAEAINKTATTAMEEALCQYHITRAISEVIVTELSGATIATAVKQAIKQMDNDKLAQHLAAEIQRHTAKAVINILQEGLLQVVCKLRGIGDYSQTDKMERAKLKAELFNN